MALVSHRKNLCQCFYFDGSVQPLRINEDEKEHNIGLFLIEVDGKKHYCLIKILSRLLPKQVTKQKEPNIFCRRCWNHFPNKEKLEVYKEYCSKKECVTVDLPKMKVKDGEEKAPILNFINFGRCVKVAFVAYADFESVTEPVDLCEPNHNQSFNEKYQKHKPIGFAYNIVCFDENVRYRSSDQLCGPLQFQIFTYAQ